jgi:hypothetical protein
MPLLVITQEFEDPSNVAGQAVFRLKQALWGQKMVQK